MLHVRAKQNVTFHCQNSVAWRDDVNGNFENAVVMMGANEHEFKPQKFDPKNVVKDECRVCINLYACCSLQF